MTTTPIGRNKLQLVGVTCLWIAAKYYEDYPSFVADMAFMTAGSSTVTSILAMEKTILFDFLNWELCIPTCLDFMRWLTVVDGSTKQRHTLAKWLCELAMEDVSFMETNQALLAAAAVFGAGVLCDLSWTKNLERYSSYQEKDVRDVARRLLKKHRETFELTSSPEEEDSPRLSDKARYARLRVRFYRANAQSEVASIPPKTIPE